MTNRFLRLRRHAGGWRRGLLLCTVMAGLAAPLAAVADTAPLRVAIPEDALTLDPIASSDNPSIWAELLIFDQLIRPTRDGTSRAGPGGKMDHFARWSRLCLHFAGCEVLERRPRHR